VIAREEQDKAQGEKKRMASLQQKDLVTLLKKYPLFF
jgi:hypothetical protein